MKAKKPTKPNLEVAAKELSGIYQRIREILESARAGVRQLEYCRAFYLAYPVLLGDVEKSNALRSIWLSAPIPHALRSKSSESAIIDSPRQISESLCQISGSLGIGHTLCGELFQRTSVTAILFQNARCH